jgi:hypothetical protein
LAVEGRDVAQVLGVETLEGYGELRCFLREGPPTHFAFEVLREVDGRAWTLRVPTVHVGRFRSLLRQAQHELDKTEQAAFGEDGMVWLGRETLDRDEELVALVIQEEAAYVFALWKREKICGDWSWTLEAVFAPVELSYALCKVLDAASRTRPS